MLYMKRMSHVLNTRPLIDSRRAKLDEVFNIKANEDRLLAGDDNTSKNIRGVWEE